MDDVFSDCDFGKIALKKIAHPDPNFKLFYAGWLEDAPEKHGVMKVTGGVFREVKSGPRKGQLGVLVRGTEETAYVTSEEMENFELAGLESLMPKDMSEARRIITQLYGELSTTKALLNAELQRNKGAQ